MSVRMDDDYGLYVPRGDDPVCDVHCDAVGCTGHVRLVEDDLADLPGHRAGDGCSDTDIRHCLEARGWQAGDRGVQRGHDYCPLHATGEVMS